MTILLGAIADDLTGATDLANTLVRQGMRTVQMIGVPTRLVPDGVDAIVVALKTRAIAADEAVAQSLAALTWLAATGARQYFFKYCSTFDSTDAGNIGPVADALLDALGADFTVFCPAFPENGRTVYRGYLFVGDVLLSESGMRDHPLTPMRDPNLRRVLSRQARGKVGLMPLATVNRGAEAVRADFARMRGEGYRHAILDAVDDEDLLTLGEALADFRLVTGGSGIALGLPKNFRRAGLLQTAQQADRLPPAPGASAVISGSCSTATLAQVAFMRRSHNVFDVDPLALAAGEPVVARALDWAEPLISEKPLVVSASADPDRVRAAQDRLGRERAGSLVESALAEIARGLVQRGVCRLVVAGGETSGAVVQALGIAELRIGPQIEPGVPWTASLDEPRLALALKSGNFGREDFFLRAMACLD
ncbi:MAG TPA: 3-oxo-tetronate kinase [Roseiarcus sp.]|nr:3-oxo-tetronate kinase [Roseiarcus sp.]HKN26532.1 3-oxo-tetronate kinase [Roseiarcus sp.]